MPNTQWLDIVIEETEQLLLELYEQRCNPEAAKYKEREAKAEAKRLRVIRYNKQYYLHTLKTDPIRTARRRQTSKAANERKSKARHKHAVQGVCPEHKMRFTLDLG